MYVPLSLVRVRYSRIFAGSGCRAASSSRTSASVDGPLLVFFTTGSAELAEQHLGQLLGRGDVERGTRQAVDLAFEGARRPRGLVAQTAQVSRVEANPRAFHVREHRHQRQLDVAVELLLLGRREPRLLPCGQGQNRGGFRVNCLAVATTSGVSVTRPGRQAARGATPASCSAWARAGKSYSPEPDSRT